MIRRLIAPLGLCAAMAAHAEPLDFRDLDKQLHVGASTLVGMTARHFIESPNSAMAACIAVGAAKEVVWQAAGYTKFSTADMVANTVGCVMGAYVIPGISVSATRASGVSVSFRWSF